jgi:hypothetical protein
MPGAPLWPSIPPPPVSGVAPVTGPSPANRPSSARPGSTPPVYGVASVSGPPLPDPVDPFGPPPAFNIGEPAAASWPSPGPITPEPTDLRHAAHQPSTRGRMPDPVPRRAPARFQASDLLWPVPGLWWVFAGITIWPYQRNPTLLIFTSLSVAVIGFAVDSRFGHRLPWWAKPLIAFLAGFGLVLLMHAAGAPVMAVAVLLLLASIGGAWALLRHSGGRAA